MVNLRLLGGYMTKNATATADFTAAGYFASNAVNLERNVTWKSSGTGAAQLLKLNTTASITPTGLGIANGNYSKWGTTKLRHSTDGSSWTDFLTLSGFPADGLDYYTKLTGAPSKAWWALQFGSPSAAPEVGIFYLGELTTLLRNPSYPMQTYDVWTSELDDSEGLITVAEDLASRDLIAADLTWRKTPQSVVTQIRTFMQGERGNRRPFFYVPIDEAGSNDYGRAYVVRARAKRLAANRLHTDPSEIGFTVEEQV